MKYAIMTITSIILSAGAFAQDIYSSHSDKMVGCYKRVYSSSHLNKNPSQQVKEIQLSVSKRKGELNLDLSAKDRSGETYLSFSESAEVLSARPEGVYLPSNDVLVETEYDSGTYYVNFGTRVTVSIVKGSILSMYTKSEGDAVVGDKTLQLKGGKIDGLYLLDKISSKPCR